MAQGTGPSVGRLGRLLPLRPPGAGAVDHVISRKLRPDLALDPANLRPVHGSLSRCRGASRRATRSRATGPGCPPASNRGSRGDGDPLPPMGTTGRPRRPVPMCVCLRVARGPSGARRCPAPAPSPHRRVQSRSWSGPGTVAAVAGPLTGQARSLFSRGYSALTLARDLRDLRDLRLCVALGDSYARYVLTSASEASRLGPPTHDCRVRQGRPRRRPAGASGVRVPSP
jgi:hypothetical protein